MTCFTPLNVLILIDFKPKMSFQLQTEAEKSVIAGRESTKNGRGRLHASHRVTEYLPKPNLFLRASLK